MFVIFVDFGENLIFLQDFYFNDKSVREKVVLSVQLISYTIPIMGFVMNTAIAMNLGANLFTMKTDLPVRVVIADFVVVGTYYLGKLRN